MVTDPIPFRTLASKYHVHDPREEVENIEMYRAGGYHPVRLGDEFASGRYSIIHKLGHGSYSTVWLARDHMASRYVSLKLVTAAASKLSSEAKIGHHLNQGKRNHPGRKHVLSLLDDFLIDGPNGQHQCLVGEVVGSSIVNTREFSEHRMLSLKTARDITAQLALGLAFLHSCGVIHGDLHIKNIMFALPCSDFWTVEQIYEHFSEPSKNLISRLDDQPLGAEVQPYAVTPACFWTPGEEGIRKQLKIIDFGEASLSNEKRKKLHTPMHLRSPESFFDENIGLPADNWAMACTIFDIFGNESLFGNYMAYKDRVLLEMVATLGKLPIRWWDKWENRDRYFSIDMVPTNETTRIYPQETEGLRHRIQHLRTSEGEQSEEGHELLNARDAAGLEKLLASLLRYEPSERVTAEESLKSEWMKQLLLELEVK